VSAPVLLLEFSKRLISHHFPTTIVRTGSSWAGCIRDTGCWAGLATMGAGAVGVLMAHRPSTFSPGGLCWAFGARLLLFLR
jgi:hypothetical protein